MRDFFVRWAPFFDQCLSSEPSHHHCDKSCVCWGFTPANVSQCNLYQRVDVLLQVLHVWDQDMFGHVGTVLLIM